MAFIRRPNYWLCLAAFAAAFWVTLRVVAAPAAPLRPTADAVDVATEVRDPALERMIARFAADEAASTATRRRGN